MKRFKQYILESSLEFAKKAHAGQQRSGGLPYIVHPITVAQSVQKYKGDSKNINALKDAAHLHDTVEDTEVTIDQIRELFGDMVASLVQELTSDSEAIQTQGKKVYLATKMEKMSSYGLVIKLADRLDNVQDIATAKTPEWRQKYKAETEYIISHLENNRYLSNTHKNIISDIRNKLNSVK